MIDGRPRLPDPGLSGPDARVAALDDLRWLRVVAAQTLARLTSIHLEMVERVRQSAPRVVAEAMAQQRATAGAKTRAGRGRRYGRRRKR